MYHYRAQFRLGGITEDHLVLPYIQSRANFKVILCCSSLYPEDHHKSDPMASPGACLHYLATHICCLLA